MRAKLRVVGLGPGGFDNLPLSNLQALQEAQRVYLRTSKHPGVESLTGQGIKWTSFDGLYQRADSFEQVYREIVKILLQKCREESPVVYAVPGHPLVAETSVSWLLEEAKDKNIEVEIMGAQSFLDAVFVALQIDPIQGTAVVDAMSLEKIAIEPTLSLIITQVYSRAIASEVKLTLMEYYPDDFLVKLVRAAGVSGQEKVMDLPLYELDRVHSIDYLTTLYVPPLGRNISKAGRFLLDPLVRVMEELRGENGCPWDKEQNHDSLKRYLVEEAYEVIEAIEDKSMYKLCEELGDLLLQVVFHAQLAREEGHFDMNDVVQAVTKKMIRRHPHVFGDVYVEDAAQVKVNWEEIKELEKGHNREQPASLVQVTRGLPALLRAEKVQAKASRIGFDWPDINGAWSKVEEELRELSAAIKEQDSRRMGEELGDVLFAVVNVARFLKLDPEETLNRTVAKFIKRFRYMEEKAGEMNRNLADMTLEELDILWEEAKKP